MTTNTPMRLQDLSSSDPRESWALLPEQLAGLALAGELETADLGDKGLNKRAAKIADATPGGAET